MKLTLIFFILPICFVFAAYGQQKCTPLMLAQKPGSLRASKLAGSTGGVSAADLTRSRATLTNIHKTIAAAYNPTSVVGDYSFSFSKGEFANIFGYSLYLLKYNCDEAAADKSKFYIGTDTPTVVRINANFIYALDDLTAAHTSDNTFRGYFRIRNLPRKVDGFYYLGDNPASNTTKNQKAYTWLVTYNDELPFTVLTRKEYLLLTKARLAKAISQNGNSSGFYNEYVNRVNDFLKKSETELNQPAIIKAVDEERFTGFLEENAVGAFAAVKHNPAYYKKGLPKSAAHFFTVTYSVYEGDEVPVYVDNINAVKKALDLNVLKNLLGK